MEASAVGGAYSWDILMAEDVASALRTYSEATLQSSAVERSQGRGTRFQVCAVYLLNMTEALRGCFVSYAGDFEGDVCF
ncbi:hypothetical protein NDU88_002765 [Pleurodeles waltl]|uniref:Uncharacterized protein n=1 Tax=Pleurodeles waltl TaxID=8319 RepID=A0AAV7MWN1_PLEWA|nr:hypothetical protein NDU88_002765 [Pleurodeles waltl]